MLGKRQSAPGWARLGSVPFSVFALLAFAVFSPLAVAADSSEVPEYTDAPPPIPKKSPPQKAPDGKDRADGGNQSSTSPGSPEDGSSEDESKRRDESGAGAGSKNDDGGGKGGQGDPAAQKSEPGDKPIGSVGSEPISHDDSSPLVPILIALAVLAAISIGIVTMRRRRQDADPGSSVSPGAS